MALKTLSLAKQADKNKLEKIEQDSKETRLEGMFELFCDLVKTGKTASYDESRIYYLAYLLTKEGIEVRLGFRNS